MARRRRRGVSERELHGLIPKLEPGDDVPRTGEFRLDKGVRVQPFRRIRSAGSRAHPEKPPRVGRRKIRFSYGTRRRSRRRY